MTHFGGGVLPHVCAAASRPFSTILLVAAILVPASADAQGLPSGWTGANIGDATPSGRASFAGDTFTVEGGGARIAGSWDQFYFVYQRITGDTTIVARVGTIENTHSSARAGVMIRESLTTNSRHAFAAVTPSAGIVLSGRTATGGATDGKSVSGSAPVWLRLVRSGSRFTASRSADGNNWTTIGRITVSMGSSVYVGLAVSSYNTSQLATATFHVPTAATPPPPTTTWPSGWIGTDVGSPSVDGGASYTSSGFSVSGGGTDINGTSDQFGLVYRQASGDIDVVTRVASLDGPSAWSKGGVMIRSSLAANSAHATLFVSRGNGVGFRSRPGTGLATVHMAGGSSSAPIWLKLERRGSAITAFRSSDGSSWTMIGSQTLALPSTFYVGLAVNAYSTSTAAQALFANVNVAAPDAPTTTPPTVALTAPTGGTYTAPATVNLAATASDPDDGVAQVEFYANGTLLGTDTSSPYAYSWSGVGAGTYSLTAVARNGRGAVTTSAAVSITVNGSTPTNNPPSVSLTAPAGGATYVAPASVTMSAAASDSDGSVARVDFYAGSTLVGSDTSSPYSATWSNAPAGTYSLTAVARDNAGATRTSSAVSITINNPAMPNRAVFGASPDHATVTRYVLDIFTAGANPGSATPVATRDLGRPSVVNGECNVDISSTISGLPGGNYFATVVAVSPAGTSPRTVSGTFAR
jgi:regulation of enolase protein 1 (concanavalin A-like superfamily)